jgi:hypothetical protein
MKYILGGKMRLEEVWEFFSLHNYETCGTHKLFVKLKQPISNGQIEGYIFLDPGDSAGCENKLEIESFSDLGQEVENVWCPFCLRIIYPSKNEND